MRGPGGECVVDSPTMPSPGSPNHTLPSPPATPISPTSEPRIATDSSRRVRGVEHGELVREIRPRRLLLRLRSRRWWAPRRPGQCGSASCGCRFARSFRRGDQCQTAPAPVATRSLAAPRQCVPTPCWFAGRCGRPDRFRRLRSERIRCAGTRHRRAPNTQRLQQQTRRASAVEDARRPKRPPKLVDELAAGRGSLGRLLRERAGADGVDRAR